MNSKHWAICINNESRKSEFIRSILKGSPPKELEALASLSGALFSKLAIERFIDEEDRHGEKVITKHTEQSLRSMSSGEQKKALLHHLLRNHPDYIILDNPFDNLDIASQENLARVLDKESTTTIFVLLISRE